MKIIVFIFSLISICTFGQTEKIEREALPDIYSVQSDDIEMNKAIKKSRQTFGNFLDAYKNKNRNQTSFCVKMPFPTKDGAEHIWLINIEIKEGKVFGQVDNVPENVTIVKLGDKIEIEENKISDWFYIDKNKLIGGLTIRVLRDRMTQTEKREFDQQFGVKF